MQDGLEQATLPFALACAGIALLWHGLGEASRWQGSPGKRAFGLIATDIDGNRPASRARSRGHFAGVASWITLNLGHLLAALPPQHRALHDLIAGTRVLLRRRRAAHAAGGETVAVAAAAGGLAALAGLRALLQLLASIG